MHRLPVGALARAMAAAMRAMPAARPGDATAVPRILCIAVSMRRPDGLAPGWDPDGYDIAMPERRWTTRIKAALPWRWPWRRWLGRPYPFVPVATLFLSATPAGVRITLDGVRADTSTINDWR